MSEFFTRLPEFIGHHPFLALGFVGALLALGYLEFSRLTRGYAALTPAALTQLINREDAQVIDVREPAEYAAGHLPESRNIPAAQLSERITELDKYKETPLILVCQTGPRSTGACKQLIAQGFARVHNLEGGIAGWREAGLPLKKGAKK